MPDRSVGGKFQGHYAQKLGAIRPAGWSSQAASAKAVDRRELVDIGSYYDIISNMKKAPRRASLSEIAREIRNIAKDSSNVFFTAHAEQEMKITI